MPAQLPTTIAPLDDLTTEELNPLLTAAEAEGFGFLHRLVEDWNSGSNRFDQVGERLLAVRVGDVLVAIGGLNQDPYEDQPNIGRLRHIYVLPECRRRGLGRGLVETLLEGAAGRFRQVRLRTKTAAAAAFYERIGFVRIDNTSATHALTLQTTGDPSPQ